VSRSDAIDQTGTESSLPVKCDLYSVTLGLSNPPLCDVYALRMWKIKVVCGGILICSSLQLYKEIELCCKIRKVIQFDRDESCMIGYGESQKCFMIFMKSCLLYNLPIYTGDFKMVTGNDGCVLRPFMFSNEMNSCFEKCIHSPHAGRLMRSHDHPINPISLISVTCMCLDSLVHGIY